MTTLLVCRVTLLVLVVGRTCLAQSGKPCPSVSDQPSCVCKSDKGIIDLTPLVDNGSKPRFANIPDPSSKATTFSYNPCSTFNMLACLDCYACEELTGTGADIYTSIASGSEGEKMYINTDGRPYLHYAGSYTSVTVYLQCTKHRGPTVVLDGTNFFANGTEEYTFVLSSCQVCPGGCKSKSASSAGVVGIVMIVLLLLAVVAYLVIGAIIMKFKCGATGTEIIPQKDFWKEVPFLIKDGCVFSSIPIKRLYGRVCNQDHDGYETIR